MDRVGDALDVRAFGGDGVTADEVIQIFESFCDAEFQKDLASSPTRAP
ncbi:MAG: hypothetical protein WA964_04730 [Ilumatobacter sp.]